MSTTAVECLRLRLPPLRDEAGHAITAAWRQADGEWQRATFISLTEIARLLQAKQVEVCPHPDDLSMTEIELPPLRAKALRMAVHGAVELLALLPPTQLVIGYGERHPDGTLPVAWLAAEHLQQIQRALAHAGLRLDRLLPPPAFLPAPAPGEACATVIDNWLVIRTGAERGTLLPFPPGTQDGQSRPQALFPASTFHWLDAREDGEGWRWSLPLSRSPGNQSAGWLRPAACWLLAAALVWLGGLNLYAWKLQTEGQKLKQQMAEQVQAVFPQLTVVLNPLQQARQMRDAHASGNVANSADFATLLRLATGLLNNSDGQVAQVNYQPGQLSVRWRAGATLRRAEMAALVEQARERQLMVQSDEAGLHFTPGQTSEGPAP